MEIAGSGYGGGVMDRMETNALGANGIDMNKIRPSQYIYDKEIVGRRFD